MDDKVYVAPSNRQIVDHVGLSGPTVLNLGKLDVINI